MDPTRNSIEFVRDMISKKKELSTPFMATGTCAAQVVTDQDHHPYTRFFRGVYYYPDPIVIEREAGWRPVENSCYFPQKLGARPRDPPMCFEAPCGTIFPCKPKVDNTYYPCVVGRR